MRVRIGGAWREIESGRVRVGGAWRNLVSVRVYTGGSWKEADTFIPDLSLSAVPAGASGSISGAGTVTTSSVTATPTGGQGPFTYSWVRTSGSSSTVTSPASASTTFRRFMPPGEEAVETWECTATDSFGTTASVSIIASFISFDDRGSGEIEP